MAAVLGLDNEQWIRSAFGVRNLSKATRDQRLRLEDGSRIKFSDTTFGGGKAINQPPAFTEFADMPIKSLVTRGYNTYGNTEWEAIMGDADTSGDTMIDKFASNGIGPAYEEIYESTGEYLTLRFGLPKTNSLLSFLLTFYDARMGRMARTGETESIWFKATSAVLTVVGMALSPAFLLTKVAAFLVNKPISRFYYLDPKMHLYWMAANIMLNSILVNTGDIPRINGRDQSDDDLDAQWARIEGYYSSMPDIFKKNGSVDLFGVANRYNRLSLAFHEKAVELINKGTGPLDFLDELRNNSWISGLTGSSKGNLEKYIEEYLKTTSEKLSAEDAKKSETFENTFSRMEESAPAVDADGNPLSIEQQLQGENVYDQAISAHYDTGSWSKIAEFMRSAYNEGGEFITWRVESTGSTQESFSTSTGQSAVAQGMNSAVEAAQAARFNLGGFKTGIGIIDSIGSAVGGLVTGAINLVGLDGLHALLGNAFVDIPDIVTGSSTNMPDMSYTIELRPWSNDPVTRITDLHAPTAMALAMILPISTGKHSYALPFICEGYSRSRIVFKLAAVTQMSLTRGVGNLGRNADGDPLGITISFTLTNLSKAVHMPINTDMGFWSKLAQMAGAGIDSVAGAATGSNSRYAQSAASLLDSSVYDDSSLYTDYLAVLGGLSLQELIYVGQKLRLNMTRSQANFDTWFSSSNAISSFSGSFFGRALSLMSRGTVATN